MGDAWDWATVAIGVAVVALGIRALIASRTSGGNERRYGREIGLVNIGMGFGLMLAVFSPFVGGWLVFLGLILRVAVMFRFERAFRRLP